MTEPSVSIAIRAHRREWLDDAITSVLAQTHRDLELVIHDDTGTLESVATRTGDSRIRYCRGSANLQASGRLMAAAMLCRAPYLGFLDDDDRYEPQFVQRLLRALQDDAAAGVAFCRTTWVWKERLFQPRDSRSPGRQREAAEAMLRHGWTASPSHMLIRRSAFEDALRRQPMPDGVAPDVFLNLQIAFSGWQHVLVDAPLVTCRWHEAQLSRSAGRFDTAVSTWQALTPPDPTLAALRDRRLARALLVRAFERIRAGRASQAREDLVAARRVSPASWRRLRSCLHVLARAGVAAPPLAAAWAAWSPQGRRQREPPRAIGDRALTMRHDDRAALAAAEQSR